jgi:uncharacterized protein (DUF2147 family)
MWFFVMQNAKHPLRARTIATAASAALAALAAASAANGAATLPREAGLWLDDTGKGAVRIEPCGGKLCGRIVWLKEPLNPKGEPLFDKNNPNPTMQKRPICGLPILGELQAMSDGGFDGGWVYDPKDGNSYTVAIDLTGPDQLKVTGYKGVRFLGKSFMWTRIKTDVELCNAALKPAPANQAAAPTQKAPATASAAGSAPAKPKPAGEKLPWGQQ